VPSIRKNTRLLCTLATAVACLGAGAAAPAGAAATPMQLGVFLPGAPGSGSTLDSYSANVGRRPDLVMAFRNMSGPFLYSSEIANLKSRGITPLVTLEPYLSGGVASFPDIVAGKYDSYFRREADALRGLGMTVEVRFAHEMNLLSSDWGPGKAGNTGSAYAEAWRHIVSIFRAEGASNVKWVWAPNIDYGGRPFNQFYPGDEWVDYVGLDGYNWGTGGGSWETFSKIFGSSYKTITQLSSKPLIITETACSETGGSKAAWIEQSFLTTIPQEMPRVSAVVWFDENKEEDWRVESSQSSLDAYRKVVASNLYGGSQDTPVAEAPAEEVPVVEELEVTPTPTPAPAPAPEPTKPSSNKKGHHKRLVKRVKLRGTIKYRISRPGLVRIVLDARHGDTEPLAFSAVQGAGKQRVGFAKLVGDRSLRRGDYRVSVTAFSSTGAHSLPRRHGFRIAQPGHARPGVGYATEAS
jgi:hypothetical protein